MNIQKVWNQKSIGELLSELLSEESIGGVKKM